MGPDGFGTEEALVNSNASNKLKSLGKWRLEIPLLKPYSTGFDDGNNYTQEQQSRWKEGELGSGPSSAVN